MPRGKANNLAEISEAVLKPLLFASKDNFHNLDVLKGLPETLLSLANEALSLDLNKPDKEKFLALKKSFSSYEEAGRERKLKAITSALALFDKPVRATSKKTSKPKPISSKTTTTKLTDIPITEASGIGPKLAERFLSKGFATIEDLLYFLPLRYEDRRDIKKISAASIGESAVVSGEILLSSETRYGRRKGFEVALSDGTGILTLKWFNFRSDYMKKLYEPGKKLICYGPVTKFGAKKEMIHPDVEFINDDLGEAKEEKRIVPIYSQIEKLHQKTIRKIIQGAATKYASLVESAAPSAVTRKLGLMELSSALKEAHKVGEENTLNDKELLSPLARRSIVFDELFSLELGLLLKRRNIGAEKGIAFKGRAALVTNLLSLLPFELTGAQAKVASEIEKDMRAAQPMNRLIQGDVGCGKTIVSLIAALTAVEDGYQAAIMAPTEILAEQHYLTIKGYIEELGLKCLLLKGGIAKGKRKTLLEKIASGEVDIIIGTHALFQGDVEFHKLGLAVTDEQHRFGVLQRSLLKERGPGVTPDVLVMTATPIPRTLAMTIFGDMDVSIIDELPPGRTPVKTVIVREKDRKKAYEAINKEVHSGGQVYVIYPLVEESEELPLKDATKMAEHMDKEIFPDLKVGLLHGRMKSAEKEAIMADFKAGNIDILVATTVIEVGVDVPNASLMIIEHAERFGLAQLHQLRGRVGRGKRASKCVLLAQWTNSDDALKRLRVMERTSDGFIIAEEDLKIRGPGDFIGTRQSGMPDFRLKETLSDLSLLKSARAEASGYLELDPELSTPEGLRIRKVIRARWAGRLSLSEVG